MKAYQSDAGIVLSTESVSQFHGSGEARAATVCGVSVEIQRGAWTSVMGSSGSGKTSLLHLLARLSTPNYGRVALHRAGRSGQGKSVREMELSSLSENARAKLRRTELGVVLQDFNLVRNRHATDPKLRKDVARASLIKQVMVT